MFIVETHGKHEAPGNGWSEFARAVRRIAFDVATRVLVEYAGSRHLW
jgi:hypothetical protein